MRTAFGKFAAWALVCALGSVSVAWAVEGVFNFSDDFGDRDDQWDNAQTNTALPAWSAPGGTAAPKFNGTPILLQVVVNGPQFQVIKDGSPLLNITDNDLQPGSVGIHSWAQQIETALPADQPAPAGGQPQWGTRCQSLTVVNGASQTILQENWTLPVPGPWVTIQPRHANGTLETLVNARGNFKWDFTRGSLLDDTNNNEVATVVNNADTATVKAHPAFKTDFLGSQVGYAGPGSNEWTDYRFRTRVFTNDNDGIGVIFRYFEDANSLKFYRVCFASENNAANSNPSNAAFGSRPPRGISIQKLIQDKTANTATWMSLYRDPDNEDPDWIDPDGTGAQPAVNGPELPVPTPDSHVYAPNVPFDVVVTVQNLSATETKIDVSFTPLGGSEVVISVTDNDNPIQSGSIGFFNWGTDQTRFFSHGGENKPVVETLDAEPVALLGDIFKTSATTTTDSINNYNDWISALQVGAVGRNAGFGIHLETGDLIEASDGREADSAATADGRYKPYILYKQGFNSGTDYTLTAALTTNDNDGFGVVFGYVNRDNYFRVGLRAQAANLGFPTGVSVQKVVNGTITQLGLVSTIPPRANQAGIWVKRFGTGAIVQADNANMYDTRFGVDPGIEYQGPRLVRGNVAWTDYTYETVIEAADDDGVGILFRYQDEKTFYRLMFQQQNQAGTGAPPVGVSLTRVVNNVHTVLLQDTDPTAEGNNDTAPDPNGIGFIYDFQNASGPSIFRPRVTLTSLGNGHTQILLQIDAFKTTENTFVPFYSATIDDPAPIPNGKVGLATWGMGGCEFRDIKLTLAGQAQPEFVEGDSSAPTPDPKGWSETDPLTPAGALVGTKYSLIGLRVDLDDAHHPDGRTIGASDNGYAQGSGQDPNNLPKGTPNFGGLAAVVGKLNWKDYRYGADMRMFDDDGVGIIFRYQDNGNFYRLMFMQQANNNLGAPPRGVSVQKARGGQYTNLFWNLDPANPPGTSQFIYRIGQRWRAEVTAVGSHFDIKVTEIDGPAAGTVHTFSVDDPVDPILTGKAGVTVWGANGAAGESNTLLGLPAPGLDWTKNFSESGIFDNIIACGTVGRVPPELTGDDKIDFNDLVLWSNCVTGPNIPMENPDDPVCDKADVDNDGDVDSDDFGYFQRCFAGSFTPFNPQCVEAGPQVVFDPQICQN